MVEGTFAVQIKRNWVEDINDIFPYSRVTFVYSCIVTSYSNIGLASRNISTIPCAEWHAQEQVKTLLNCVYNVLSDMTIIKLLLYHIYHLIDEYRGSVTRILFLQDFLMHCIDINACSLSVA